jgi:hypothetical protein
LGFKAIHKRAETRVGVDGFFQELACHFFHIVIKTRTQQP